MFILPTRSSPDLISISFLGPLTPPSPIVRAPVLNIEPSTSDFQIGSTVDLRCTGANPGSTITWIKNRGDVPLPSNCQASGPILRIHGLRSDNDGMYTCQTSDSSGNYNVDFVLRTPGKFSHKFGPELT